MGDGVKIIVRTEEETHAAAMLQTTRWKVLVYNQWVDPTCNARHRPSTTQSRPSSDNDNEEGLGSGPRCQSSGVKNTLATMQGRSGSHWLKDRLVALHYPELAYLLRA